MGLKELWGELYANQKKSIIDGFIEDYNTVGFLDVAQFMANGVGDPGKMIAAYMKFLKAYEGGEGELTNMDYIMKSAYDFKHVDRAMYQEWLDAIGAKDTETCKNIMKNYMLSSDMGQDIADLQANEPTLAGDLAYIGAGIDNNNITSSAQLQDYQDLVQKMEELQAELDAYVAKYGVLENGAQSKSIDGTEMDVQERAIYEEEPKIEVAESLEPKKVQTQELKHGDEFLEAEEEVGEEELEQAEKVAKEREITTEDGAVSVVMGNSEKVKITIEPYIEGDKESDKARSENTKEARESSDMQKSDDGQEK